MLRIQFVGRLMTDTGYAVVTRRKDRRMDDAARRALNEQARHTFATRAREDAVSVGIFPEGERYAAFDKGQRWQHVGKLKGKAGFRHLCEHLPRHTIVSATVIWPLTAGGKTVLESDVFCDQSVEVVVHLYRHIPAELADTFLEEEWETKEQLMRHQLPLT